MKPPLSPKAPFPAADTQQPVPQGPSSRPVLPPSETHIPAQCPRAAPSTEQMPHALARRMLTPSVTLGLHPQTLLIVFPASSEPLANANTDPVSQSLLPAHSGGPDTGFLPGLPRVPCRPTEGRAPRMTPGPPNHAHHSFSQHTRDTRQQMKGSRARQNQQGPRSHDRNVDSLL